MGRIILLLLFCVSVNAQSITVSGTTYELTGEILSDPNTYLYQFIEDAGERGHNFSGVIGTFSFFGGRGGTKGWSRRGAACSGGYDIGIQEYFWNNFDNLAGFISGSRNLYEQRRFLIYHELGHALLRFNHVCHGDDILIGDRTTRLVVHDIMFASTSCNVSYSYTNVYNWDRQLDRMFNPGYQTTYPCNSGKGGALDY